MTREEWRRVKGIVAAALAHPDADRPAFLNGQCGPDAVMRGEVESLLAATVQAAELYEDPTLMIAGARLTHEALEHLAAAPLAPGTLFHGTDRYTVRRQMGVGGMGIVYEVDDRTRHQIVALKTLLRWDAADMFRLKREFRSLANIAHTNLASLYDLVVDAGQCFFTMELVDGATFVEHVRESGSADIDRVRRALPQLVDGLEELHRRGKLHGDIKPSNVLVTPAGRVVILDFGLTSNLTRDDPARDRGLVGTPAYLSPEQCLGVAAASGSDWYSVGVTLYQALTGRVPFEGSVFQIIESKTTSDPPPPSSIAPETPDELNDACMALLCRDPETRISGREALRRLSAAASAPLPAGEVRPREAPFVGREYYLDALSAAFKAVKEGRSASVYIHGPSGIGKSALVQCFFDQRLAGEPLVSLRGRCHEHESVPYKGLDGVIDSLSRYLHALPREDAARLTPRDAAALARLFPVMQIAAGVATPALEQDIADPVVLRRRAFAALRELLVRVADRQPLVVDIDDFQWADVDSAVSLTELLRPPNPPRLLLIVSFRSEEIDSKPFLRGLVEHVDLGTKIALPLAPLTQDEVSRLIATRLPPDAKAAADDRLEIATEAGGNPFLVEELTRYVALGARAHRGATLEEMLERRLDALPAESRAFLETLAVCGRPIRPARVFEACGLTGDERPLVARLRAAHFLRSSRSGDQVEMYHDRIRETLAAEVSRDAARQIHDLMARILIAHGDDDPEALFEHYRAGGHDALAAPQAAAAAARASSVLAFDRAAALYRHALDLQPQSPHRIEWITALAAALENAGRPAEAAEAYLDAAKDAHHARRVEWLRKAAELLLNGGHIDRGLEIIHAVLPAVGMRLAPGPRSALASILVRRAQLAWRGLEFKTRDASEIPPDDLLRIDTCWSITTGLAMVDNIRASAFHIRQLVIALETGEPYRVARALALEAGFSALGGGRSRMQRSAAFSARAHAMAYRIRHPHAIALSELSSGTAAFALGRWQTATERCGRALRILREECTGVVWEMNLAQSFFLGSLMFRGELRDVSHTLPGLLQAARDRGNLYFETELSTRFNLVWLAADDPAEGERQANAGIARWSGSGFHRQHYNHVLARVQTALYRGRPEDAWTQVTERLEPVRRSLWLRVQFFRIETAFMRARCALALAAAGHDAPRMRGVAAQNITRLERENMPWSSAIALLMRAALAHLDGDSRAAADRLTNAVEAFSQADMQLYAAVARRRLAGLLGADRGRSLQREADDWMASQEIRNPAAMTRLLAPGFPEGV